MKALFWAAFASGPLALALWWGASLSSSTVEALFSRGVYPLFIAPWSRFLSLVPFALAPVLVVLLLLGAGALFFFFSPGKSLAILAAAASVLVAWFVLSWGLNYQRQSWAASHGLAVSGGTVADLEALSLHLGREASRLRPLAFRDGSPPWLNLALSSIAPAYERVGREDPLLAGDYGSPKPFPWADGLSWLGIAGIFIPHTGEPLVNPGPASWQLPFTAAHEAAHLRGWAREDEANYLAFFVLKNDPHPAVAYSVWASALLYTASALESAGPLGVEAWKRVAVQIDPGIFEDWKSSFAYWDRFRGPVQDVSQKVNDLYLKSQGQSDGVKSYGRMVDLLLATERRPGETSSEPAPR